MMLDFDNVSLGDVVTCSSDDGCPESKMIGRDDYSLTPEVVEAGLTRDWPSLTMVPTNLSAADPIYRRWWLVNMPLLGPAVVTAFEPSDMPAGLIRDPRLCGQSVAKSVGNADGGTGKSTIECMIETAHDIAAAGPNDPLPPDAVIWRTEDFEKSPTMYFKMRRMLKAPSVYSP